MLRLHRVIKSKANLASLAAAGDFLFPNLSFSRETHSDGASANTSEGITSRTKRDNRIRFFVINNRPSDALDLLERSLFRTPIVDPTAQNKIRYLKLPPASVCNKVLDSAAQTKDEDLVVRAADLAGTLQLQGVAVEPRTAQALLHGLAQTGMVDRGILLLDSWLAANLEILEDDEAAQEGPHHVMSTLLEAAARADDPEAVQQVLLRMAKVGFTPSPHTLITILQCFTRLGHFNTAHSVLQWMRRSNMEPTAHAYAALMTMPTTLTPSTARTFLKKAKEAYEDMKANNVQPSAHFYAAFINVCGRLRDLDSAQNAWLDMETAGVVPDLICYNTMINACAKGGDVAGSFHLFEEMVANEIKPDAVAFATLLSAVHAAPDQARRIWKYMIDAGIQPDVNIASVYLDVLLLAGDSHAALSLLRESSTSEAACAVHLYEQAISTAALKLQAKLLRSLVVQMKGNDVPVTSHMVSSLLMARARKARGGSRWRLLDGDSDGRSSTAKIGPLQLGESQIIDKLIQAIDSSPQLAKELLATEAGAAIDGRASVDAAAVAVGWLSAEGRMDEALEGYENVKDGLEYDVRAWVLRMLLAGAIAAPADQQIPLVLKIMGDARTWSKAGGGWWWDHRTQRQITKILRRAPEASGLLKGHEQGVEGMEAKLRRFVRRR